MAARATPASHTEQHHASAVALARSAVLITGPSASGKSSLALALMDRGARLVGDDRLWLAGDGRGGVLAWPPEVLAGLMEVRGVGILRCGYMAPAPVTLAVHLVGGEAADSLPRLPDGREAITLAGVPVPGLALPAGRAAELAPRVAAALRYPRMGPDTPLGGHDKAEQP